MKRLFKNILLLLFPFIIYGGVPLLVLVAAGEMRSYESFTQLHNERKDVFLGMAYSGPQRYMKLHSIIRRQPDIIAMGNSRSLPIRSFFFRDSSRFYNAGVSVATIKQYQYFLELIPDSCKPKVILMSIDGFFFIRNWDDLAIDDFSNEYSEQFSVSSYLLTNLSRIWTDVRLGKISINDLFFAPNQYIGLSAKVKKQGYRYDGSHYYGSEIPSLSDTVTRLKESYEFIEKGIKRFEYSDTVNPPAFVVLDKLLAYCKAHNIYVAGYFPSYAHGVYRKMQETGKYKYMDGLYGRVQPIFGKYGYSFFDFNDIYSIGGSDAETLDGYHISEKASLRLLIKLAEQDSMVRRYVDMDYLQGLLQNAHSPFEVIKGR